MPRQFNTAHRNDPVKHYTLPPLERLPPDITELVHDGYYFVLHAPRQSGKTTSMMALADKLRLDGRYAVVFCTVETARTAKTEAETVACVVTALRMAAAKQLPKSNVPPREEADDVAEPKTRLYAFLSRWSQACTQPLVLLIDEIDCLKDDGLISVLSQFRAGYAERPKAFPHSVCIFGMRDVRDYKVMSGGSQHLGTSSPFNVKRESLTVAYFSADDIAALYGQHTAETGQVFTPAAVARVWELTHGQPYLVNALADNVVRKQRWTNTIDVPQIDAAKEALILQWGTHFDSLMARLREDRVRRVIEPIIAGSVSAFDIEDLRFCRDLGLVDFSQPPQIANPIYREVVARKLSAAVQAGIPLASHRWRTEDGRLDIDKVRQGLLEFWREHAEGFVKTQDYHEVAAQLVVMAYLQSAVNGGGQILREFAAGTGRIDILIKWPVADDNGKVDLYGRWFENHLIELKVWYEDRADPTGQALEQVDKYLERVPCASASVVVFDRREATLLRKWRERIAVREDAPVVQGVAVWVGRV